MATGARSMRAAPRRAPARRAGAARAVAVVAQAAPAQSPTVADTKAAFMKAYPYPIPAIWGTVLQELLVQHHLYRYHHNYAYSQLGALGLVSVYDQVMEGMPVEGAKETLFSAFLTATTEDPATYRADTEALIAAAGEAGGVDGLLEMEALSALKAQADAGSLLYTKWHAIGLFRLLEVAGATEPEALKKLVEASGVTLSKVNGDLGMYKGILSKLQAARELMAEVLARDKKKEAERLAAKAAPAATEAEAATEPAPTESASA